MIMLIFFKKVWQTKYDLWVSAAIHAFAGSILWMVHYSELIYVSPVFCVILTK